MSKKKPKYLPMKSAPLDGTIIIGKIMDDDGRVEIDRVRYVATKHRYMKNFWVRSDWSYCEPMGWKAVG